MPTSKKLVWDEVGERLYETGVDRGVLYPQAADGTYPLGIAWNGMTKFTENPSGAEPTDLWADNIKYLTLMSTEKYGGTLNAYTYPDEFMQHDGSFEIAPGVYAGQQTRKPFGFSFRTLVGNDTEGTDKGYRITLVYNCLASPSGKDHSTVNDSPEAVEFSWEITTTPVEVKTKIGSGDDAKQIKPVSTIVIDSTKITKAKLTLLENALYGTDDADPYLPTPDQVIALLNG